MAGYDYLVKLLVCGESGTGKSCLMRRYVNDEFHPSEITTIGIDFTIRIINFKGKRIKLQIWDTPGQERFYMKDMLGPFFKATHGLIIVSDSYHMNTYEGCLKWYEYIKERNEESPILLAINKSDLELDPDHLSNPLDEYSVPMLSVSAKTGSNVNNAFMTLIDMIFRKNPEAGRQVVAQDTKPPDFLVHYDEHKPEEKTTEEVPTKVMPSNETPCCCEII